MIPLDEPSWWTDLMNFWGVSLVLRVQTNPMQASTTPLEKSWNFLNPRGPLNPQILDLLQFCWDVYWNSIFFARFGRNSILQALGELAASRRGFFFHKNSVPGDFQHVSNNMFVCFWSFLVSTSPGWAGCIPQGLFPSWKLQSWRFRAWVSLKTKVFP